MYADACVRMLRVSLEEKREVREGRKGERKKGERKRKKRNSILESKANRRGLIILVGSVSRSHDDDDDDRPLMAAL